MLNISREISRRLRLADDVLANMGMTAEAMWSDAIGTTTHPAMIRARLRSPNWQMHRKPSFASRHEGRLRHATTRLTAGFRYVGPPLPYAFARTMLEIY